MSLYDLLLNELTIEQNNSRFQLHKTLLKKSGYFHPFYLLESQKVELIDSANRNMDFRSWIKWNANDHHWCIC